MKNEKLFAAMGQIDEDMIVAAMEDAPRQKKPMWIRYTAVAAALVLTVGAGAWLTHHRKPDATNNSDIGGIVRNYKAGQTVGTENTARVWEWEYKTVAERYSSMTIQDTEYHIRRELTDETLLGEKIGTGTAYGFDIYENDKRHDLAVDVYTVGGIADDLLVAANLGEGYYIYGREASPSATDGQPIAVDLGNGQYAFMQEPDYHPADFGTFWQAYHLAEQLQLADFTYNINYDTQGSYTLTDAAKIMEMLQNCGSAPFVEDQFAKQSDCKSVCFSVTSEALGVYRHVFSVRDDGYIFTNIMDYGYRFDIGKETAKQIIDYALQHSTEIAGNPYTSTLAGQIVAIEDDCILIDDSALCENPEEGIVFRVPTEDVRISRHITVGQVTVGDWVLVRFAGDIDAANQYTVNGAFDIEKGELSHSDIMIPE